MILAFYRRLRLCFLRTPQLRQNAWLINRNPSTNRTIEISTISSQQRRNRGENYNGPAYFNSHTNTNSINLNGSEFNEVYDTQENIELSPPSYIKYNEKCQSINDLPKYEDVADKQNDQLK